MQHTQIYRNWSGKSILYLNEYQITKKLKKQKNFSKISRSFDSGLFRGSGVVGVGSWGLGDGLGHELGHELVCGKTNLIPPLVKACYPVNY